MVDIYRAVITICRCYANIADVSICYGDAFGRHARAASTVDLPGLINSANVSDELFPRDSPASAGDATAVSRFIHGSYPSGRAITGLHAGLRARARRRSS